MKENKKSVFYSCFWKWFLNSKIVTSLLIIFLILLIIFMFTKVSYIFIPLWKILKILASLIILPGVLYYILNPVVDFFEKKGLSRTFSIIILFFVLFSLIIWGIFELIPKVQEQTLSFIDNFPYYIQISQKSIENMFSNPFFNYKKEQLENFGEKFLNMGTYFLTKFSQRTFENLGNFFETVVFILIAIITMPFILFFLLKDGKKLVPYFLKFIPIGARKSTFRIISEMNHQLSSYIRGQLTIAFVVAITFIIGFSIIDLDYSIAIGISAGFLNLLPHLGSFVAMIPAILVGIVGGPLLLLKVIFVFIIEQTIESRIVSPLILGNRLSIHPVTIFLVLLSSGKVFGLAGVILGIPAYALIKVVISNIFKWYQKFSHLYPDNKK